MLNEFKCTFWIVENVLGLFLVLWWFLLPVVVQNLPFESLLLFRKCHLLLRRRWLVVRIIQRIDEVIFVVVVPESQIQVSNR